MFEQLEIPGLDFEDFGAGASYASVFDYGPFDDYKDTEFFSHESWDEDDALELDEPIQPAVAAVSAAPKPRASAKPRKKATSTYKDEPSDEAFFMVVNATTKIVGMLVFAYLFLNIQIFL